MSPISSIDNCYFHKTYQLRVPYRWIKNIHNYRPYVLTFYHWSDKLVQLLPITTRDTVAPLISRFKPESLLNKCISETILRTNYWVSAGILNQGNHLLRVNEYIYSLEKKLKNSTTKKTILNLENEQYKHGSTRSRMKKKYHAVT